MMAMLFAIRVTLGKTEFNAVPAKLKAQVATILIEECGLPELVPGHRLGWCGPGQPDLFHQAGPESLVCPDFRGGTHHDENDDRHGAHDRRGVCGIEKIKKSPGTRLESLADGANLPEANLDQW